MAHRSRGEISGDIPLLITQKLRADVPGLRTQAFIKLLRASFRECAHRPGFRLVHYAVRKDELLLIAEADDGQSLGNAMRSVSGRFARAANRAFHRSGPVFAGRYETHVLETPADVRRALVLLLRNMAQYGPDEFGSGAWAGGWIPGYRLPKPVWVRDVAEPESELLTMRWRREGLIDPGETPMAVPRSYPEIRNPQELAEYYAGKRDER